MEVEESRRQLADKILFPTRSQMPSPNKSVCKNNRCRGHYPICFCSVLAGGGVKRGFVYGASDKEGAYPDNPVTVHDLHATIGWAAGLPLKKEVISSSGRPFFVGGSRAKPVNGLFA